MTFLTLPVGSLYVLTLHISSTVSATRRERTAFVFCFVLFLILGCKEVGRKGEWGMVFVLKTLAF